MNTFFVGCDRDQKPMMLQFQVSIYLGRKQRLAATRSVILECPVDSFHLLNITYSMIHKSPMVSLLLLVENTGVPFPF